MASVWFQRRAAREAAPDPIDVLALGYLRVSTKKQDKGLSPEAQAKEVAAYIRQHGWEPGPVFRDTLQGTRDDRPDYQRMLDQVRFLRKQGRHVVVVAAALDRTGRDLAELFTMRKALRQMGVHLHYTRDGGEIDDDSAMLKGWQAAKETEKLSIRVSASKVIAAEKGLPPGGAVPWGYELRLPRTPEEEATHKISKGVRRILDVDETQAAAIRKLFQLAADGETLGELARWVATLTDEQRGMTHNRKHGGERVVRTLNRSSVLTVLRNPMYVARYTRDAAVNSADAILALPKGKWPALIDDDLWRRVQVRLDGHKLHPRQASGDYLLTGYLRCPNPECGSRMHAWNNARQQSRYRCTSSVLGKDKTARRCFYSCPLEAIDADVLRQVGAVLDAVLGTAADPELLADLRAAWDEHQAPVSAAAARARQLDAEIERLRTRIRRAREDLYDEEIDQAEHDAMVGPWRKALAERERERAALKDESAAAPRRPLDEVLAAARSWQERLEAAPTAAKREVLAELVERVEPVRVAYGQFRANITKWTDTGETLREMAEALAGGTD